MINPDSQIQSKKNLSSVATTEALHQNQSNLAMTMGGGQADLASTLKKPGMEPDRSPRQPIDAQISKWKANEAPQMLTASGSIALHTEDATTPY